MEIPPGLTHATTYVVVAQPTAVDRWHVLPDMTVIYERRSGEFEQARVLTAATLRDRPALDRTPRRQGTARLGRGRRRGVT